MQLPRSGFAAKSAIGTCDEIKHHLDACFAQVRTRGRFAVIGGHTDLQASRPQCLYKGDQRCGFDLWGINGGSVKPANQRAGVGFAYIRDRSARDLMDGAGHDQTVRPKQPRLQIIAKRLCQGCQLRWVVGGFRLKHLTRPNAPRRVEIKKRAVLVENDALDLAGFHVQCTASAPVNE